MENFHYREIPNQKIPSKIEIPLFHVRQRYNWDCGVSAVMMVLCEEDQKYLLENLEKISSEEEFEKSTWTIDLAYLLLRFGIRHLYCTITWGVNPGYTRETFYEQVLSRDEQRVSEKFSRATEIGVNVQLRSVDLSEILLQLQLGNPAIILVNANLLYCEKCHFKCLPQLLNWCCMFSYQGHYIVACGYNMAEKKILYRNPTLANKICIMPFEDFDKARRSFGTDEDVIFVYKNKNR